MCASVELCCPSCLCMRISQDIEKQEGVDLRKSRQTGYERLPRSSLFHCLKTMKHCKTRVQNPWMMVVNALQETEYEWELVCCSLVEMQCPVF